MVAKKSNGNTVLHFTLEKETKGALRYKEVDVAGNEVPQGKFIMGTSYLRKSGVEGMPKNFTMTLEFN